MRKPVSGVLSIITICALMLTALSFSIGIPIYCRDIYYMQIDRAQLCEITGASREEIVSAYDEILDYLTEGKQFGTGVFTCSDDSASHFADCKRLFDLNLFVFIASMLLSSILLLLHKGKGTVLAFWKGYSPFFFAGSILLVSAALTVIAVCIDFEGAFTIFHQLLFPGKTNWEITNFSENTFIAILPQEFFALCGAVIAASLVLISVIFVVADTIRRYRCRKK